MLYIDRRSGMGRCMRRLGHEAALGAGTGNSRPGAMSASAAPHSRPGSGERRCLPPLLYTYACMCASVCVCVSAKNDGSKSQIERFGLSCMHGPRL